MIKTVLSIEDDRVTQILNKMNLKSCAFCEKVIEAYDGTDAIDFFKKLDSGEEPMEYFPEIILLDINMPIMNGWEFFDAFKQDFPHFIEKTKIFVLSSSIDPDDEKRAKDEVNIVAFLTKPVNTENLEIIRQYLGR